MAAMHIYRCLVPRYLVWSYQTPGLHSSAFTVPITEQTSRRFSTHLKDILEQKHNFRGLCRVTALPSQVNQSHISDFQQNVYKIRLFSSLQCCLGQQSDRTFQTDVEHIEKELEAENKFVHRKKKQSMDLRNSMINVGKFVQDKILVLQDEDGTSLGTVNRHQAVALSQEKKLKLVLLNPSAKPWPLYKLMTGQELHQEQLKRNEKMKKKMGPTQVKEIKASWNIGQHDIDVRRRHLEDWFSDGNTNIHVRVTVTGGRGTEVVSQERQMDVVKQLMVGLEERITLNGPPRMTGKWQSTLSVTLRLVSAKEKAVYKKDLADNTNLSKNVD